MKSKVDVLTASTSTKTKIPTVSKEELVDWVTTAWRVLEKQTELIKKSFIATGITAAGNRVKADTVLNYAYEKPISNIQSQIDGDVESDDEDPFNEFDDENKDPDQ